MNFPHIDVVREYLAEEFPGLEIEDKSDFDFHAVDGQLWHSLYIL